MAVVGGGLAGLSAALELVDRGQEVVLHEARPTLGGAVQTLPEREGDPPPPPDNGQHIALGCFTAYQRFLARIGRRSDDRPRPPAPRLQPCPPLVQIRHRPRGAPASVSDPGRAQ